MKANAVVLAGPGRLSVDELDLTPPTDADVVVDVIWSGISTGTERLLWSGRMPNFPGMGYPLVPGYETVGRIVDAGPGSGRHVGETVFVPGASCFGPVRGLFGGAAQRVVVPGARARPIDSDLGARGILFSLAATARHVFPAGAAPNLIVGHGVFGRLLARLAVIDGASPVVWECAPDRRDGAHGYSVVDPAADSRRDYRVIVDASGDMSLVDTLIQRLAPGGELVLAGFYDVPISFGFASAFMREARLRVAAQWREADLIDVMTLVASDRLSFDGLITDHADAGDAPDAYRRAFADPACLKMVLDWRDAA